MDNGFTARTAADGAVHSDPAPLRFLVVDDERTNLLVLDAQATRCAIASRRGLAPYWRQALLNAAR